MYVPWLLANVAISDLRDRDGRKKSVRGLLCTREFSNCGMRTRNPLFTESTLPLPVGTWNSSGRRVRRPGTDSGNMLTISAQSRRPFSTERANVRSPWISRDFTDTRPNLSKGQATLCVQSAQYRTRSSEIAWLSTCIPYQLNIVSDYAIRQYRTNASGIAHLVRIVCSGLYSDA